MANKLYVIEESDIVFGSEVGDDVALSSESISNNAGRQSAHHDLGARSTAAADRFRWRAYTQSQATPTVGNTLDWYLKTSDGTHHDNDDGTGDIAVSAEDKLKNLSFIGSSVVDQAAANIEYVAHGTIHELNERYVAVVMWNTMGATTTSDAAETKCVLTPMPYELQ